MKYLIPFLVISSFQFSFFQNANARIIIEVGDGRSAYSTSTIYFPQAADMPYQLNPSEKIMTPSGAIVDRIDDPTRGLSFKDSSGLIWTSTLMADRPQLPIFDKPRFSAEKVSPERASAICKRIGARLPTLGEYKNLAKLFVDQKNHNSEKGEYNANEALKLLDPGLPLGSGGDYHAAISWFDYRYRNYNNERFSLYENGKQYIRENRNLTGTSEYNEGNLKCVVSPDMLLPKDFKAKYESLQMPIMESCDLDQFINLGTRSTQEWVAQELACYNPESPSQSFTSPPEIRFKFDYGHSAVFSFTDRVPGFNRNEVLDVYGYSGGGSNNSLQFGGAYDNETRYQFNAGVFGNTLAGHAIKQRKDKKGCDVYRVVLANFERGGWGLDKSELLFTIGIDKRDGSLILKSDNVDFCFERIRNRSILQILKLRRSSVNQQ